MLVAFAIPRLGVLGYQGEKLRQPTGEDFRRLLAFRVSLRQFQHWSEAQAQQAGLTHVQHQLLVAIKGHPASAAPTVGDLAGYLMLRHHSAVELIDRAEAAGLVRRISGADDARVVRVELTPKGDTLVVSLTAAHLEELRKLAAVLNQLDAAPQSAGHSNVGADLA
jgi:DNA-binding MarR family transcriptional regulator